MERFAFSDVEVDVDAGELWVRGRSVALQPLPWQLLLLLLRHPGQLFDRRVLLETLWPDVVVNDESLTKVVSRLRAALAPGVLQTVPRRGYRLVAEVRRITAPAPPPVGGLVGRRDELGVLRDRITEGVRALTIVGPAGVGKTHLAREFVAHRDHGVFADLVGAPSDRAVLNAVLDGLGAVHPIGDPEPFAPAVLAGLAGRLLVLDNAEDHLAALRAWVPRWLESVPDLVVLVTSQVPLGVPGERLVRLGPLDDQEGAELLARRAPDVPVAELERLSEALGGLPLALELAAPRLLVLSATELAARVAEDLDLLRVGPWSPGHPERHRSLQAALEGSWRRLEPPEQVALARLMAWETTFDLARAEVVLDESMPVVDLLQSLVGHSMLTTERPGRFGVLPTIRAFVRQIADPAEVREGERRHAAPLAVLGTTRLTDAQMLDYEPLFDVIESQLTDLRAAHARALDRADGEVAARCALAMWAVLSRRGAYRELLGLVESTAPAAPPAWRPWIEDILSRTLYHQGRIEDAVAAAERATEAAEATGDSSVQGHIALTRARLATKLGRSAEADRWMAVTERLLDPDDSLAWTRTEQLAIERKSQTGRPDEKRLEALVSAAQRSRSQRVEIWAAHLLGRSLLGNCHYGRALTWLQLALEISDQRQHATERGHLWFNIAFVHIHLRDNEAAASVGARGADEARENYPHIRAGCLVLRGWALARLGHHEAALAAAEEGTSLARANGHPYFLPMTLAIGAEAALTADAPDQADRWLEEAEPLGNELSGTFRCSFLLRRIHCQLRRGIWVRGVDNLAADLAEIESLAHTADVHERLTLYAYRARYAALVGEPTVLRATLDEAQALAASVELDPETELAQTFAELDAAGAVNGLHLEMR